MPRSSNSLWSPMPFYLLRALQSQMVCYVLCCVVLCCLLSL